VLGMLLAGSGVHAEDRKDSPPAAPAAPTPNVAPASAPSADAALMSDDESMLQAITAMEQVTATKEKSVRAKIAIDELRANSTFVDFAPGGSLVSVVHHNELASAYVLVGAVFSLDGTPLYARVEDSGDLNLIGEQVVYNARVPPGQHRLAVQYELRGNGYGVLSYLEDIRLTLRESYSFSVDARKVTNIASTVFSTGSLTRLYKDRPGITFVQTVSRERESDRGSGDVKPPDVGAGATDPVSPEAR
jgi:hypothetical protein